MRSRSTDEWLDDRATTVDGRFDRLESQMDSRFDHLEKRLDWLIGMFIAAVVALIAKGVLGG